MHCLKFALNDTTHSLHTDVYTDRQYSLKMEFKLVRGDEVGGSRHISRAHPSNSALTIDCACVIVAGMWGKWDKCRAHTILFVHTR